MADLLTELGLSEDIIAAVTIYGVIILAAFWLALVLWAYRDMRARSRDFFAQIGMALLVAVLTVPGVIIYLLLRPRETLSEAYERSLEEEALLQEIEEKPTCPGCGQRVKDEWLACPHCHTRLKKACIRCGKPLELSWNLCPHCTTGQTAAYQPVERPAMATPHGYSSPPHTAEDYTRTSARSYNPPPQVSQSQEQLEFIEGEDI